METDALIKASQDIKKGDVIGVLNRSNYHISFRSNVKIEELKRGF